MVFKKLKKFKKLQAIVGALVFCLCSIGPVKAASVTSDDYVHQYKSGDKYYVQSYFNPSHTVQNGEGFGLVAGKNVKQAYVRARADGSTVFGVKICSSYDSGRVYSSAATSRKNTIMSTSLQSVNACSKCTQRTNYGWIYF